MRAPVLLLVALWLLGSFHAHPQAPAIADFSDGIDAPESDPSRKRASLLARIAAEPHRIRELMNEAGLDWCGMPHQTAQRDPRRLMGVGTCRIEGPADLPANRDACIPNANTPLLTLRLKFNVFRNDDGSSAAATQAQVEAQVAELNAAYAPARIRFVHTLAFINASRFRSLSYFENSEEDAMKSQYADRPEIQHNIYVVDIEPAANGGSLLGVSTFPWDAAATRSGGGTILDDDSIGAGQKTLVHELGHALGLWHTHHGVREVAECSACWESADGTNADTTGDFCSDTPPTPVNYKCQPPGGTDPCTGRAWGATAPQNYMGYAEDACYTEFTPQQAGRMHCWIRDSLTGWQVTEGEASVTLVTTDANAAEAGPDAGVLTVTRTGSTALPLTVRFAVSGTATPGADYLTLDPSVVLPAGSASATLRVTPIDDTQREPAETVVITLAAGAGYTVANPSSGTITIADNDAGLLPLVSVSVTDANASEAGTDPGVFTVSRDGPATNVLTVSYGLGGTATASADYAPVSGSVTLPVGTSSATVTITPIDDTQVEPNETVTIRLNPGATYEVGTQAEGTVTIADNDTPANIDLLVEAFDAVNPPALPAGWESGAAGAGIPWQTTRFDGVSPPNIVIAPTVEAIGDSVLTSPAFTVPASGAELSFVHGFEVEEGYDGGVLEISIAGAAFVDVITAGGVFAEGGYTGFISTDDGSPIAGRAAWTGNSGVNIRTVLRLPATAAGRSVRLRWRLASDAGIAESGWGMDDILVKAVSGGAEVLVTVVASDAVATEAAGNPGEFTVSRTGATTSALSVNIITGGTATAGSDFGVLPAVVQIPAGNVSQRIPVNPVNDTLVEGMETVVLTVVAGAGYSVGNPASATVTLEDDDGGGAGGVVFAEAFDGVPTPVLPAGWNTAVDGLGLGWFTIAYADLSPPNIVVAGTPEFNGDQGLVSPPVVVSTPDATLTFDHGYLLEDGYDGGILEVSINGGAFVEIVRAGGQFLSGGYNGTISTEDGSAIAGQAAWTGDSGNNLRTQVRLPASAAGGTLRLRWRLVSDGGIGGGVWGLDNVQITETTGAGTLPVVQLVPTDSFAAEYGPDTAEVTVSRTGSTTEPLTVTVSVGGTASAGSDYAAVGGSLTIPAGSSTAAIRIVPVNDAQIEGTETVVVTLQSSSTYTVGANNRSDIVLLDNGTQAPVTFAALFDEAAAPALPAGWSVSLEGAGSPWSTQTGSSATPPNWAFAGGPDQVSDNSLISPPIAIRSASTQLIFVHQYQLEPGYDGGVLEIALDASPGSPFQDIVAAGGRFVTGEYDGPLSQNDGSPIPGRMAWTGDSQGSKVTRIDLPATWAGRTVRFRWRCATDAGVSDRGWWLDTVALVEAGSAGGPADVAIAATASPVPATAQNRLTYTLSITNLSSTLARDVVVSNAVPALARFVSATASQGTVTGTNQLVARLGLLNGKASASVTVVVIPDSPGTLQVSANVTPADADPDPSNNGAGVSVEVRPNSTPTVAFANSTPVLITESAGPAGPYPSPIQVSGFEGSLGRVAVTLHGLSHSFPDDLDILLVGPGGQKVLLMSDAGGDQRFSVSHVNLTFADDAPEGLPDRGQILSGSYRPTDFEAGDVFPAEAPGGPYETTLGSFRGINPNGIWRLFVVDDESKDGGRLAAGWSLDLTRAIADSSPPTIVAQPQSRVVEAGSTVTLSVVATGTPVLTYQWRFNGVDLPGRTSAELTLSQVTASQTGEYTVRVSNGAGVALSAPALVTVTTQARRLVLGAGTGIPGGSVTVPVTLRSQGNENRMRFSVGFNVDQLRFSTVGQGSGALGSSLSVNVNQLESGRVGVQLSLPAGQAFQAGEREVALLEFEVRPRSTGGGALVFLDAPIVREILDSTGAALGADYLPGEISVGSAGTGPTLSQFSVSAVGTVQMTISAPAGVSVRVESSIDLKNWTTESVLAVPAGQVVFTGTARPGESSRFYRVVQLP